MISREFFLSRKIKEVERNYRNEIPKFNFERYFFENNLSETKEFALGREINRIAGRRVVATTRQTSGIYPSVVEYFDEKAYFWVREIEDIEELDLRKAEWLNANHEHDF